jgi:ArsR family transcriptional regulator
MKKLTMLENENININEACCTPNIQPVLSKTETEQTVKLFAALADETRLAILNLLAQSQGEAVCQCDITASFKQGQPTISHHLKILRDEGLISGDKRGKWVYYSLVPRRFEEIKAELDRVVKIAQLV